MQCKGCRAGRTAGELAHALLAHIREAHARQHVVHRLLELPAAQQHSSAGPRGCVQECSRRRQQQPAPAATMRRTQAGRGERTASATASAHACTH